MNRNRGNEQELIAKQMNRKHKKKMKCSVSKAEIHDIGTKIWERLLILASLIIVDQRNCVLQLLDAFKYCYICKYVKLLHQSHIFTNKFKYFISCDQVKQVLFKSVAKSFLAKRKIKSLFSVHMKSARHVPCVGYVINYIVP